VVSKMATMVAEIVRARSGSDPAGD
jgi:hypothetical protein